jgi:dipeptidyl aminopeptidase/acylaminoacyl peptidase
MTIALLLAACVLVAPPEGRITVWVGDKVEHFKPDGTDVQKVELPDGYPVNVSTMFNPARSASQVVDVAATDLTKGIDRGRLILAPVAEKEPYYILEGYVVLRAWYSADGKKVYFVGGKGDELPQTLTTAIHSYVMDVATKNVQEVILPEKHTLEAVSPDGKAFVTAKVEADLVNYSRRTYLVPAGKGDPAELLGPNVFPSNLRFSPDGTKLLARRTEYAEVYSNGKGGFRSDGVKPREYVVVDLATRKETKLLLTEEAGLIVALDWSPDGTKLVFLRPEGRQYKVTVADAAGTNAKEIYKLPGKPDRAFIQWR